MHSKLSIFNLFKFIIYVILINLYGFLEYLFFFSNSQIMTKYLYGAYIDKLDELCEILAEKFINVESGPVDAKLQKMGRIKQTVC